MNKVRNLLRPVRTLRRLAAGWGFGAKSDGFVDWAAQGFATPCPPIVKRQVLRRHGIANATWIETGTYLGDTTAFLAQEARRVYSIEPEPDLYRKAARRFLEVDSVEIVHGASEAVFEPTLLRVEGDLNLWLDGHYSAGVTFKGATDTPIMDELLAIERRLPMLGRVAVFVDDVRCFRPDQPEFSDYPSLDELVDWARRVGMQWSIEFDIFIAKRR